MHPGQFSTSPIYLFMSGPQEAVLQVALKESYKGNLDVVKEPFTSKDERSHAGCEAFF
jgi:hypothetical protein